MSGTPVAPHHVVLFDGDCGLCSRFVQLVLSRDRDDKFRFAPLQGSFATKALAPHGKDPRELTTVYVIPRQGTTSPRLLEKARAVVFILSELPGMWKLARLLSLIPTPILNAAYNLVAKVRYRLFGKPRACPAPDPSIRHRFID
ncbi:MAG: DUF393 domain-containing protein [Deltaproteobacteria bacterium]|nr:DUF393 domain-containing protein [Deltaproteobacteria bacterium]